MKLKVVIPQSSQELALHKEALDFLATFLEEVPENYTKNLFASVPNIILFYTEEHGPLAVCQCDFLDEENTLCEIHGVIRQDLKEILPRRNSLANIIVKSLLSLLFEKLKVEKVLVAYDFKTLSLLGFIRRFGLKKWVSTSESQYYELSRDAYIQKILPNLN